MSERFRLKILAADKVFYEGEAVSVTIPVVDGSMQILAHHEPMVVATIEGLVQLRVDEKQEYPLIGVAGLGFTEIGREEVVVLVDSIERPQDIDEARAREALARAQEQLLQDQSIQEYKVSKASVARAMLRLSAVGKQHHSLNPFDDSSFY
ncbi:MAG: ATP synthase F1 subunit epsilon [Lachnospiraceae bacterium]|jgi:F-type H+-transporting ATPase subunit epsilon|nr:ATP synthase F1 subunit epsilon [Lachnospiraceae bacterium]